MAQAVMMRGRMVHFLDGRTDLQRYGRDDSEVIWSVHRGELNVILLDIAERAGARLHFDRGLSDVDFDARIARFIDDRDGSSARGRASCRWSAPTAPARRCARRWPSRPTWASAPSSSAIPTRNWRSRPRADGGFRIEPNALHIWPRGRYMCIALPNDERTFTVTLFLPNEGDPSFATVRTGADARALFERDFADALPLIPNLEQDFERNPAGLLATLYLDRWHLDDRAVLLGDAAHAMVPFHGQGMNCAFEDCVALAEHLDAHADRAAAFAAFEAERLPNAARDPGDGAGELPGDARPRRRRRLPAAARARTRRWPSAIPTASCRATRW